MQKELSITVKPQDEKNENLIQELIQKELKNQNIDSKMHEVHCVFAKKSIDARHGQLKIHLRYKVYIDEQVPKQGTDELPQWKKLSAEDKKIPQVVIVGSGPAGLFGALKLLELGVRPIIVERGEETSERKRTIAKISTESKVNGDSNYCFGEGGAGTFSDGKLYTRSNKRGNISRILQIFVKFGANPLILTDAHPHIGTEKLPLVINEMKKFIIEMGGCFQFNTRCVDFIEEDSTVKGIVAKNTVSGEQQNILADISMNSNRRLCAPVILAIQLRKNKTVKNSVQKMATSLQGELSIKTGLSPVARSSRVPDKQADDVRYWVASSGTPVYGFSELFVNESTRTSFANALKSFLK